MPNGLISGVSSSSCEPIAPSLMGAGSMYSKKFLTSCDPTAESLIDTG